MSAAEGCSSAQLGIDSVIAACEAFDSSVQREIDKAYAELAERIRKRKTIFGRLKYPHLADAPDSEVCKKADRFDRLLIRFSFHNARRDIKQLKQLAEVAKNSGARWMNVSRSDFNIIASYYIV